MSAWDERAWASIAVLLDGAWHGEFDEAADAAYRMALRHNNPASVATAVDNLAATLKWRPQIVEIVEEVRRIEGTQHAAELSPPWHAVLPVCEKAAYRFLRNPSQAESFVRDQVGPVAADWFRTQGRSQILSAELGSSQYANRNAREIGATYDDFVASARETATRTIGTSATRQIEGSR